MCLKRDVILFLFIRGRLGYFFFFAGVFPWIIFVVFFIGGIVIPVCPIFIVPYAFYEWNKGWMFPLSAVMGFFYFWEDCGDIITVSELVCCWGVDSAFPVFFGMSLYIGCSKRRFYRFGFEIRFFSWELSPCV